MENKFLWEEQLKKFEEVYFAEGIREQFFEFLRTKGRNFNMKIDDFMPRESEDLYTTNHNMQYHLNGRSILGIQKNGFTK